LLGFAYATLFAQGASGDVDHCSIHHNRVIGLGYGVSVASGARVRVTDNQFFDCRHMLASNGAGNSGWTGRKTHWEFVHNRVYNQNRNANQQAAVDAHPGFDGTFLVEANSFENHDAAVDILGSSGRIQRNHFRNLGTGVSVRLRYSGGVPGAPHDIAIEGNRFTAPFVARYQIETGERITVDGTAVRTHRTGPAPRAKP
jgi:parallel beta helix pectate lyase-like protein